jgi:hypothetical protein
VKTPLELATEHANAYVRERGGRVEPLSWEEVRELLESTYRIDEDNWAEGYNTGFADGRTKGIAEQAVKAS